MEMVEEYKESDQCDDENVDFSQITPQKVFEKFNADSVAAVGS